MEEGIVKKWELACANSKSVLLQRIPGGSLLGVNLVAKITEEQLYLLEERALGILIGLTSESEMLYIETDKVREVLPEFGYGSVGLFDIDAANEIVCLIVDTNDMTVWWVHLYFE